MKSNTRFLSTFEEQQQSSSSQQHQTPPVQNNPPTSDTLIPVSAVTEILRSTRPEAEIRQEVENARRANANSSNNQPPAQNPPRRRRNEEDDTVSQQIQELNNQVGALAEALRISQLETFRAQAIANAIQTGRPLIESMVVGSNTQEIMNSIAIAQAEYELIQNRIRQDLENQFRAAGQIPNNQPDQQPPQQQAVPQAYISQTQPGSVPQQQIEQPPAPQAGPSVPSFILPVNAPGQQPQGLSPEDLAYLTSSTAIRNGDYAKYRHLIQGGLQHQTGHAPPRGWSFTPNGSQIAPPVPPSAPTPAMQHSTYAGVTFPQANPGYQRGAPPQQGFAPRPYVQPPQGGYPQQPNYGPPGTPAPYGQPNFGRPPQPIDLNNGESFDPSAAVAAASSSINDMRRRSASQPSTH